MNGHLLALQAEVPLKNVFGDVVDLLGVRRQSIGGGGRVALAQRAGENQGLGVSGSHGSPGMDTYTVINY
jgi:hypothetical protein